MLTPLQQWIGSSELWFASADETELFLGSFAFNTFQLDDVTIQFDLV